MASLLIEHTADGTLLLRLNRPEQRNALATPLLEAIAAALADADRNPAICVALITGNDTIFAAGADLNELAESTSDDPVETPRFNAWATIRAFSKPLIAAVEGWCLGAGAELMMCADIVIAGDSAKIGQPETNLGIIPGAGGTAVLPRIVGRALAMKMVLTGKPISAQQALQAGLIAEVVDSGAALDAALMLASKLASRAPLALQAAKASILDAGTLNTAEHLVAERKRFITLLGSQDKTEGITAFMEKRTPVWKAR